MENKELDVLGRNIGVENTQDFPKLELVNPQWELKNEYLHVTELFQSPFTQSASMSLQKNLKIIKTLLFFFILKVRDMNFRDINCFS